MQYSFYASTFIDESLTRADRRGNQRPTGNLSGMIVARKFFTTKAGKVRAQHMLISFSWKKNTAKAKATALAKAIKGMEEMPELENNPPLSWIPPFIKEKAREEISQNALRQS